MAINTLQYATLFQQVLDKKMIEDAKSGFMEDNAGQAIWNGGNTVKIPIIDMNGAGNYNRDTGYVQGAVSLTYETQTFTMDRGRKFLLDSMDVNETNFMANAMNTLGEFQRTKLIPELDAYRFSKIAALAIAASQSTTQTITASNVLTQLKQDILAVQDVIGDSEPLVIIMTHQMETYLSLANQVQHFLDVSDFQQGDLTTKARSIDGIPIIAVSSSRMWSAFTFYDGVSTNQTTGGFAPATGAQQINWIICARRAPIAISKTTMPKIIDPAVNQNADSWIIAYRKYHDLWVKQNALPAVYVDVAPAA